MNKIDLIAIRVAEQIEPRGRTYSPGHYKDVVKLVFAELSKDAAPKAYWHETETGLHCVNTQPPSGQIGWKTIPLFTHPAPVIASEQKPVAEYVGASVIQVIADYIEPGTKLFTSPPNTADIKQRVAEACALVASQHNDFYLNGVEIAKKIRSGKWREYL